MLDNTILDYFTTVVFTMFSILAQHLPSTTALWLLKNCYVLLWQIWMSSLIRTVLLR